MATLLSGHRDLANAAHRAEVAALWGVDARAREAGQDRGRDVRRARCRRHQDGLDRLHESRAIDAGPGERSRGARAARSSSCCRKPMPTPRPRRSPTCCCRRRRGARRKARSPTPSGGSRACARRCRRPGEARADWRIAVDFARRLEARLQPAYLARTPTLFPVFVARRRSFASTSRRPRAATSTSAALSYARARRARPAAMAVSGGRRCAAGSASTPTASSPTADGRARFAAVPYVPVAEKPDAPYPFRLNTGRLRDQWHGMSRTGTVAQLFQHAGEPSLQLHASDLAAARIRRRRSRARRVEARRASSCRSRRSAN